MNRIKVKKSSKQIPASQKETLLNMLEEITRLREEISLLLPHEDLKEYAHPERIRRSYTRAVKQYPPAALWR